MLYIKFLWFCFKLIFELKKYKGFLEYDKSAGKSYRVDCKTIDQKIKLAKKQGNQPKSEHMFLSMFYSAMQEKDPKQRKNELPVLFCSLFLWSVALSKSDDLDKE